MGAGQRIIMINTIKQIDHQDEIKVYISDNGYLCIEQESVEFGEKVIHSISKNNIKDFIALCNSVFNDSEGCKDA